MRTTAPLRVCTHIAMAVLLYNWGCKAAVSTSCSYFGDCAVRQVCDGSTCICDTQHYQSGVNCLIRLNPGLACPTSPSNACKDSSVCIGGVCTCINGYYDSDGPLAYNGICTVLIALSGTCTSGLGVTQCQTNGADCATDNRCRCNQGTFDSNGFGTAGGTCVSVNFLKATLSGFHNDGTTSVTIHWSAPATYSGQVSRYDVVWAEACGGTRTGTTATSLQVTGLQSATTYNFYIKSIESGSWTADQEVTSESSILVTTKSLLGDTCTAGNCADPNAVCSNTKCVCKSGYYDNDGDTTNVGGTCTARLNPGVTCPVSPTNACKDKSVCTNGFCTCNYGYYDSDGSAPANSGTCMERLNPGVTCPVSPTNACKDNSQCIGNKCTCDNGYYDSDGPSANNGICTLKIQPGESCFNIPKECTALSTCSGGICTCNIGYYDSGATCQLRLNPGVACPVSPTNACKDNSQCIGNMCTCNNGYYDSDGPSANNGICTPKLALSVSCNSALTGVVQCSDTNAECTGGNVCRCQTGYFDSNGYNTAGGTCTSLNALKVTSVIATSVTTTDVTISWTESATPSQVSSYTVTWTQGGNPAGSLPVGKVTSAVITGLSQSTTYVFKVTSIESGSRLTPQQIESDDSGVVTTNAGLTVGCGVGINCADSNSECVQDDGGTTTVCRCISGYFDSNGYSTAGGMCVTMSTLAVTGITLVKVGTDTVNISWTPPTEYTDQVNSYRVSWSPATIINGNSFYDAQLTTAVQLVGFTPGQTYTFSVSSVESGSLRNQDQSTQVSTSPITMMPATPTSFLATDVDGPTIVLIWTLPSGIKTSYDVITTPSLTPTTTATEYIIYSSGVTDGQRYNISITTVSGSKRSDPLVATFRTVSKTPDPPTSLTCHATTDQSITLSWTAPSLPRGDIQYYVVQRVDIGALFTTTSSTTEYTVASGLQAAMYYTFNIATVNDAVTETNQSSFSSMLGCATKAAMSLPPETLVVSQILSRQFTLNWTLPAVTNGALGGYRLTVLDGSTCVREVLFTCTSCPGYSLFLSASSCGAGDKLSVVILPADLDSYTYTVATMNPYINYTVSVLAVNDAGDGHPNTTYVITDQEVPQSPSTLTVSVVSSTEIRVSWTISGPEPGPTIYTLYIIPESPETSRVETVIGFSTTALLVTSLEEYRSYTFNLTASTIKGTAAYYSPALPSAKTNAADPGPVENFVVARPDGPDFTTVTVSWSLPSVLQRNSDITKFIFTHNTTGGNLNSVPEVISVVNSVTRTLVVVPQTTYYIEVYAVGTDFSLTEYVGVKSTKIYHAPPGEPEPPSLLICKAATDQTISLTWSAPSQSSGPSIQYYVVNSVTTGAMFSTTSNLTEYTIEYGLKSATTYIFSVASVNDAVIATNQRTYSSQIGCTTTNNVTDSLFIPGVVLTVTGILALLITLGLLIAFRRNKLCCSSSEPSKQKKYQNVQLSERGNSEYYTTPSGEGESTQYQTFDGNELAKASVYSEIGGTPRVAVYQNDPGNDRDGGNYESLHGLSNPNFYDELQTKPFGNKGTYKNVKPPQHYR